VLIPLGKEKRAIFEGRILEARQRGGVVVRGAVLIKEKSDGRASCSSGNEGEEQRQTSNEQRRNKLKHWGVDFETDMGGERTRKN